MHGDTRRQEHAILAQNSAMPAFLNRQSAPQHEHHVNCYPTFNIDSYKGSYLDMERSSKLKLQATNQRQPIQDGCRKGRTRAPTRHLLYARP